MNYRSVDLPIELEIARRQIAERVSGLDVRVSPDSVEFRTLSGFHVATLSEVTLPDGERGTRLKSRTAIVSSQAAHARRKANEIRSVVHQLSNSG